MDFPAVHTLRLLSNYSSAGRVTESIISSHYYVKQITFSVNV